MWDEQTHQSFLKMIRSHWRGGHLGLFEDRGSPHTAEDSMELAKDLQLGIRFLPTATPKLNAMDHLWRHVKRDALGDRATESIDQSADSACQYILQLRRRQRLQKAGGVIRQLLVNKLICCERIFCSLLKVATSLDNSASPAAESSSRSNACLLIRQWPATFSPGIRPLSNSVYNSPTVTCR